MGRKGSIRCYRYVNPVLGRRLTKMPTGKADLDFSPPTFGTVNAISMAPVPVAFACTRDQR